MSEASVNASSSLGTGVPLSGVADPTVSVPGAGIIAAGTAVNASVSVGVSVAASGSVGEPTLSIPGVGAALGGGIDVGGAALAGVPFGIPGGIPDNIIAAANHFEQAGSQLSENQGHVQNTSDLGQWIGEAASAHTAFSSTLGSNFASASASAQEVAQILRDFAAQLSQLQAEARHAMDQWMTAWEEHQSLQSQIGSARSALSADHTGIGHDRTARVAPATLAGDTAKLAGAQASLLSLQQSSANADDALAVWSQRGQAIWNQSSVLGRDTAAKLAAISVPVPPVASLTSLRSLVAHPDRQAHRDMLGDLIAGGIVAAALAKGVDAEVALDQDILDIESEGLAATPGQLSRALEDEEKITEIDTGLEEVTGGAALLEDGIDDGAGTLGGTLLGAVGNAEISQGDGLITSAGADNAADSQDERSLISDGTALSEGAQPAQPHPEAGVTAGSSLGKGDSGSGTIIIGGDSGSSAGSSGGSGSGGGTITIG